MNHKIDEKKYSEVLVGDIKVYALSYEISRDRRYSFYNRSLNQMHFTDNGPYPTYIKVKGFVLRSECDIPSIPLDGYMTDNTELDMNIENIFFNKLRIRSYSVNAVPDSYKIDCEIVFYCEGSMVKIKVE